MTNWYEIEGYRFGVRSTSHAFADWLEDVMAAYRSPRRPNDDPLDATYSIVVEDGSKGVDRVGKRFHIVYLGGWDIVRTLDLGRLAEATLWEMESILFPVRDDYAFVEAGLIGLHGKLCVVPSQLIPGINRSKRRGVKYGVSSPGGVSFAVDLESGELMHPAYRLGLPEDAGDRLAHRLGSRTRSDSTLLGAPRRLDGVFIAGHEAGALAPATRAEILQQLLPAVRNLEQIRGRGVAAIAKMLGSAQVTRGGYASTNQMYEALGLFADRLRTSP